MPDSAPPIDSIPRADESPSTASQRLSAAARRPRRSSISVPASCRQTELVQGLRQPLRTILSFMHILDEEYGESLDDDGRRYLGFVLDASQRMYRMVERLEHLSHLERSDPGEREKIAPHTILQGAIDAAGELVRHHRARIQANPADEEERPLRVFDEVLVEAVGELLRNAILHGGPDAHVELSAHELERGGRSMVVFEVRDHGEGMSVHDLQASQELFRKLGTRYPRDAGAGLAVVSAIARLHGGELELTSIEGEGLRARLFIPR